MKCKIGLAPTSPKTSRLRCWSHYTEPEEPARYHGYRASFNRLAKPIREQATEVRRCYTFFGCLTFVHCVYPDLDSNGDVCEWKHRGWYYFVHNKELRESYDTWKVIEALKDSGFQDRSIGVQP